MPFTINMPKLSPTMTEGTIHSWHKKPGDRVEAGDVLLEISTDKATVEHASLDEGYLRAILCGDGSKADVNAPLAIMTETESESIEGFTPTSLKQAPETNQEMPKQEVAKQAVQAHANTPSSSTTKSERIIASPLAKKLAREQGLDLSNISGSGPRGRIMSRDLAPASTSFNAQPVATHDTEEALTPMRKVIAKRLQESKATIPHFYVRQELNVTKLVAMRQELKDLNCPYTVNDFILKATAVALTKHPEMNVGFNEATQKMIRFAAVDLCVAVTIAGGLITPIIKNAGKKSLKVISEEAKALALKARDGKLQPQEYIGGSFTVSNLGMYGITEMTPIINPPQGAILGVGAASDAVFVENGAVAVGKKLVITLSCDHRIIDGSVGAAFLKTLKTLLETPALFLTE